MWFPLSGIKPCCFTATFVIQQYMLQLDDLFSIPLFQPSVYPSHFHGSFDHHFSWPPSITSLPKYVAYFFVCFPPSLPLCFSSVLQVSSHSRPCQQLHSDFLLRWKKKLFFFWHPAATFLSNYSYTVNWPYRHLTCCTYTITNNTTDQGHWRWNR